MKKHVIIEIISALLILLFVYAALSKLMDMKTFARQIDSQPFPNELTPELVRDIPAIEIITALVLSFKQTRIEGLWMSLIIMTIFTAYIALVLLNVFGSIPCACGGVIGKLSWQQHLVFNLFFLVISIIGIILSNRQKTNSNIAVEHIAQ